MSFTDNWAADHIAAHSAGGSSDVDNFLPAHARCNFYRWDRRPEEFDYVQGLGTWLRREIENETMVGRRTNAAFQLYEEARRRRRKTPDKTQDECYELKLGVWVRTQIEKLTEVGRVAGAEYLAHMK
jgi:hypothetical protein